MANNTTQKQAARQFVLDWSGKGYEKGETARFWIALLQNVYGIQDATKFMEFELPVKTILKEKGADYIDGYLPTTKVLIEQKGSKVDLSAKYRQSDGSELTPYQQARRYAAGLPVSMAPRWIVVCNFTTFEVHDMERPNDAPEVIELKDLEKEYHRLSFLVDDSNVHLKKEMEVSIQAGEIVGVLYDKILAQYKDPENPESQKSLNKLCVRIVFCLYAEDAGIFGAKDMFHDYLEQFTASELREKLIKLFHILDTKPEDRDPYEDERLLAFPYVNGGMFAGDIEIPRFNDEVRTLLLQRASDDFDWSVISPTIFGAVFESTLNPETRRSGGMHYTSIENIHKVIDPLFLDSLKAELADIRATSVANLKKQRAIAFQNKISGLKFLDPACGSGNFLTESYTSLRRLENEALRIIYGGDRVIGEMADPIKVSINQFYGIEINDFACSVAQTALWIAESQMMQATDEIVGFNLDPLPLKTYHNIKEGNALRMDWSLWEQDEETTVILADEAHVFPVESIHESVLMEPAVKYGKVDLYSPDIQIHSGVRKKTKRVVRFDYIMGNPPFIGARWLNSEQREDIKNVFGSKWKNSGILDYVCCWYKKAFDYMSGTNCHAAFVSTNSITQGEHVAAIWKPLFELGFNFVFAHRTFIWDSEASEKAHVHCVILGFATHNTGRKKRIYDGNDNVLEASNINGYLLDAPNVFIESRVKPICNVLDIRKGNQPTDGGNLIIEGEDYDDFIKNEPAAIPYIKRFVGAREYLNNIPRYCLWLVGVSPAQLKSMPKVLNRIEKVRQMRLSSSDPGTHRLADTPSLFRETNNPAHAIVIPEVSSEKRDYVPMSFIGDELVCSNKLQMIFDADIYSFGVLTSSVHMGWMRAVCGRLEMRYDYSKKIVYNNFPWPQGVSESQKTKIEQTAQAILDARALYPDSSLSDLYDVTLMPPELRKAHRANDAAVLEAYGFPKDASESDIVARLFKMYQNLTTTP